MPSRYTESRNTTTRAARKRARTSLSAQRITRKKSVSTRADKDTILRRREFKRNPVLAGESLTRESMSIDSRLTASQTMTGQDKKMGTFRFGEGAFST